MLPALPPAYAWLSHWPMPGALAWACKLLLASLMVLPQAALAGATMPLLIGYQVREPKGLYPGLARLYLLNTMGAAFGVFAGAFVLMPRLGLRGSVISAAALNLGLAAFAWSQRSEPATQAAPSEEGSSPAMPAFFPWLALGSGALGLGSNSCGCAAFAW